MSTIRILTTEDASEWYSVVSRCVQYDFYQLAEYHSLAEQRGEGSARLFVYEDSKVRVALPILLRSLQKTEDLPETGREFLDATSVYGYSGPLSTLPLGSLANLFDGFRTALKEWLSTEGVVTLFSRLHPLLEQVNMVNGLGEVITVGHTVSIDLSIPSEVQRARFRGNHKNGINRLRRMGVTCTEDINLSYIDSFVDLYLETMQRLGANDYYNFDKKYFETLLNFPHALLHLFTCELEGEVIAGGLFSLCSGIVQYHLGGTRGSYLKLAPTKLLFETVRLWANEQGAHTFHLGGGVGSSRDSLFDFKAGFGGPVHPFQLWRWIINTEHYTDLVAAREMLAAKQGKQLNVGYFPRYRAPLTIQ